MDEISRSVKKKGRNEEIPFLTSPRTYVQAARPEVGLAYQRRNLFSCTKSAMNQSKVKGKKKRPTQMRVKIKILHGFSLRKKKEKECWREEREGKKFRLGLGLGYFAFHLQLSRRSGSQRKKCMLRNSEKKSWELRPWKRRPNWMSRTRKEEAASNQCLLTCHSISPSPYVKQARTRTHVE